MWREPFGIMLQPLKTLGCILIVGWAMTIASSPGVKFPASGPLITDCEDFSPEILGSPQAVELTAHQIENCAYYTDIVSSLSSLSKVEGWHAEQARAFLRKLCHSGYQILDYQSLKALGSLVVGFNSSMLESVPAKAVLEAVKYPSFAKHLETLPPAVKTTLVEKLIDATDGHSDLVKYVPDELVPYIPASLLGSGDLFDMQDLNSKPWTSEQAAMFFDNVIKKTSDFNSLSPSILHGFTCATAACMDDERFQHLAKAMKQKNVQLRGDQLSCLARRLKLSAVPKDFDDYPKDLFLFLSPSDYAETGSCEEYITHVGKANMELLEKDAPERQQLLSEGLACLNITGVQVSKEDAKILGHLVCELGADYITASGENLLKELNQCQSFTPDQTNAIRAVLNSGDTPFGPPSQWSSSTLDELGGLIHLFDHSILQNIPKDVLIPWLKQYIESSHLPREQLASVVQNLQPSRKKRDAECPPDQTITDEMLNDKLMPIYYSPEDLQLCLKGQNLVDSLPTISSYAFTYDQLVALKDNLDKEFPDGYPSWLLPNMGAFIVVTPAEDIKKWIFTSPDTLAALLGVLPEDDQARLLIQQYVDSGGQLNSSALDAIGPKYTCLLTKDQFNLIDEKAINRAASSFDPSKCSQAMLDNLYPKAKRAFSDRHNEFPAYYNLIKPYLRGAPGEDLRALSKNGVNMDIGTFMNLRNDSVMALTIDDVKGLLGINLGELKTHQYQPGIRGWIHKQKQSDLDSLGLGLRGGLPDGYIVLPRASHRSSASPCATIIQLLHVCPALFLTLLLASLLS